MCGLMFFPVDYNTNTLGISIGHVHSTDHYSLFSHKWVDLKTSATTSRCNGRRNFRIWADPAFSFFFQTTQQNKVSGPWLGRGSRRKRSLRDFFSEKKLSGKKIFLRIRPDSKINFSQNSAAQQVPIQTISEEKITHEPETERDNFIGLLSLESSKKEICWSLLLGHRYFIVTLPWHAGVNNWKKRGESREVEEVGTEPT